MAVSIYYGSGTGSSRGGSSTGNTGTGTNSGEFQNSTTNNNYGSGTGTSRGTNVGNSPDSSNGAGSNTAKRYAGFIDTPSYAYTDSTGRRYTYGPRTSGSVGRSGTYGGSYDSSALSAEWQRFIREAQATIDAVNVGYTGSTDVDRLKFLQGVRAAILKRGQFVQGRVEQLIAASKQQGLPDAEAKQYTAYWTAAATLIPGAGLFATAFTAIAAFVVNDNAADSQQRFLERQRELIGKYKTDYEALIKLLTEVDTEGEKLAATLNTTYEAPTTGIAWYWWVALAVIVLSTVYLYQRKRKPKRR